MRSLLMALSTLVFACGGPVDEASPNNLAAQAPPPTFELSAASAVAPGDSLTLTVSGTLGEDERVLYAFSPMGVGNGPCPPVLGGVCLDVVSPMLAGTSVVDVVGNTSLSLDIPANIPEGTVLGLQAVVVRGRNAAGTLKTVPIEVTVIVPPVGSLVYDFVGSAETFVVPPGITSIDVVGWGASGGDGQGGATSGGFGGEAAASIPVVPGEVLEVRVGGQGPSMSLASAGGFNGGGSTNASTPGVQASGAGGGATDIRRAPYGMSDRLLVAGGGGGGGTEDWGVSWGGDGGGLVGVDGYLAPGATNGNVEPGTGGTQAAGGTSYQCCGTSYPNEDGAFGQGGGCWFDGAACGGGGGGWYGGGAGSFSGGGGGSSYINAPGNTMQWTTTSTAQGDGALTVTY